MSPSFGGAVDGDGGSGGHRYADEDAPFEADFGDADDNSASVSPFDGPFDQPAQSSAQAQADLEDAFADSEPFVRLCPCLARVLQRVPACLPACLPGSLVATSLHHVQPKFSTFENNTRACLGTRAPP